MSKVWFGLDFGTTNTVVSMYKDGVTTQLKLKDGDTLTSVLPTVLFFEENSKNYTIGEEATQLYLEDTHAGRYLRSIKSLLSSKTFTNTQIQGKPYDAVALVQTFLARLKHKVEEITREKMVNVILGHPVRFSNDEMHQVARERLAKAAEGAGMTNVFLYPEPAGALYSYASKIRQNHARNVLVCDIGGGTSDFTLATLTPSEFIPGEIDIDIRGNDGTRLGGDDYDSMIMEAIVSPMLGRGTTYKSMMGNTVMPFPVWIMHMLLKWHLIPYLREKKTWQTILEISNTSNDPVAIKRLITLVRGNYGLMLFRDIERAKKSIPTTQNEVVRLQEYDLTLEAPFTLKQFETLTEATTSGIIKKMRQFVDTQGNGVDNVDSIYVTGGTARLPVFRRRLEEVFPTQEIVYGDSFQSVSDGLAIYGGKYLPR